MDPHANLKHLCERLDELSAKAWQPPWRAHTFEIDCPCPNGEHCGDYHTCEEVEAPEEYPSPPGQCVVQIEVPGMEQFAKPTAALIAEMRNALPTLLAAAREVERLRSALYEIANDPHCTSDPHRPYTSDYDMAYSSGVADGHRCAAGKARAALASLDGERSK